MREVVRHLDARSVRFLQQHPVRTRLGEFYVDASITGKDFAIGLECDGREFHDWSRDLVRDAAILLTRELDAIYRLPGRTLYHAPLDVLFIICEQNSTLFTERGRINLETQASDIALAYRKVGLLERSQNAFLLSPVHRPTDGDSSEAWRRDIWGYRLALDGTWRTLELIAKLLSRYRARSVADAWARIPNLDRLICEPPLPDDYLDGWCELERLLLDDQTVT